MSEMYTLGGTDCDGYYDCVELEYDLGACIAPGDVCRREDGAMGVYDCGEICIEDTRADGICDDAFDCFDMDWDMSDCTAPLPGEDCVTSWTSVGYEGVTGCSGTCVRASNLGNGHCNASLDCAALEFDMGDCINPGDECNDEFDVEGVIACDDESCIVDTMADGICDAAFECRALSWDEGDCDAPGCGEVDLGSDLGLVVTGELDGSWHSYYEGACGSEGGLETSFIWTAPEDGLYCFNTTGSNFDTILRIFDSACVTEIECNDDWSWGWTEGYEPSWSMVTHEVSSSEPVVIMIDTQPYGVEDWSSEKVYNLHIVEGDCSTF